MAKTTFALATAQRENVAVETLGLAGIAVGIDERVHELQLSEVQNVEHEAEAALDLSSLAKPLGTEQVNFATCLAKI